MRFCPFCAQENADAASECAHCGRKLPQVATALSPALPASARPASPPPRRLPRPVPRTRPITPLPATEKPAPVEAAPASPIELHGSARARSGTLLGIPTTATSFDLPTDLTDAVERTDAVPKLETVPDAVLVGEVTSPSERIDLGGQSSFDRSTDTSISLPPVHVPAPRVPAPFVAGPMPPVPLPPPPGAAVLPMRLDPDSGQTLVPDALPVLPLAPLAHSEPIVTNRVDVPDPMQMPAHPQAGIWPSVRYLVPLARAVWARHKTQGELRTLLHEDQRRVDEALHDLGHAAWQMRPRPSELRPELDRADDDDARRRGAGQEIARLAMAVTAENERFGLDEKMRSDDVARREAEVARLSSEHSDQKRTQKAEDSALRELEAKVRAVHKQVQQHEAAAHKAETTPPDKGGGPSAAANARQNAANAQRDADAMKPELEAQSHKTRALDEPIRVLEAAIETESTQLTAARSELEHARRAHADALAKLEVDRAHQDDVTKAAKRAVRLRLVSTGTLISLHRLDAAEHQPTFAPLYERLDELQGVASARDARIGALESERHGYDRSAVQRGLIVVGAAVGLFAILLVVLSVVLARSH